MPFWWEEIKFCITKNLQLFVFLKLQMNSNSHEALESWVYAIRAVWYLSTQLQFFTGSDKYLGGGDAVLFSKLVFARIKLESQTRKAEITSHTNQILNCNLTGTPQMFDAAAVSACHYGNIF